MSSRGTFTVALPGVICLGQAQTPDRSSSIPPSGSIPPIAAAEDEISQCGDEHFGQPWEAHRRSVG